MPTLKRGAAMPLYHQLKASILQDIDAGRWRPGEQLPTEDALMTRFHVSKITVRQALRDLTQLGYIRREQGRGTFVQGPPLEEGPRELKSFTSEMQAHGLLAMSRVLEQGIVEASADISERLDLSDGDAVFRLRRLRMADGEPMGLQTAYIAMSLVPGMGRLWCAGASRCEILASRYALNPAGARETHQAVTIPEDAAPLLRAAAGS